MYTTNKHHSVIIFQGYLLANFSICEPYGQFRYGLDNFFMKRSFVIPTFKLSFTAKHLINTYNALKTLTKVVLDLQELLSPTQQQKLSLTFKSSSLMLDLFRGDLNDQRCQLLLLDAFGRLTNATYKFTKDESEATKVKCESSGEFMGTAKDLTFYTSFEPSGEELGIMASACKIATDIHDLHRMLMMHGFFKDEKPIHIGDLLDDIRAERGDKTPGSASDILHSAAANFHLFTIAEDELKKSRFSPNLKAKVSATLGLD